MKELMFWTPYIYAILITILAIILATKEEKDKPAPMKIIQYWDSDKEQKLRSLSRQLDTMVSECARLTKDNIELRKQIMIREEALIIYKQDRNLTQNKLWCENCKHSIKDVHLMTCEKLIGCKSYEKKA